MAQSGFTPISIYYSSTATNVPTAGNLVAGELAINTADGKLFYKDSAGVVQVIGTKGGVGSSTTTQVLYNSSGLVVGSANMTFSGTALTLANDASISGLTVGKGYGALAYNTAFGITALGSSSLTGNYNTAVGYLAGSSTTSGAQNTFTGRIAGSANTTGSFNAAFGDACLNSNTTGSNNTSVGQGALSANTTASNNTAVGYQAGYSNVTGTALTFMGYRAGYSNTGDYNTAFGRLALEDNTSGTENTALGNGSLPNNTTGNYNTAVGSQSMTACTTGYSNTAVGNLSLPANTTGFNNTVLGYGAGLANTGGYESTFIGQVAGYNSTGNANTFIGRGSGYQVTSGSKNTILGQYNGNQSGLDIRTASNYIVLSDGDGVWRMYFTNTGAPYLGGVPSGVNAALQWNSGTGAVTYLVSSAKYKTNIQDTKYGLADVLKMRAVTFNHISDNTPDVGVIAEEMVDIVPEVVGLKDGEPDYVGYERLSSIFIKAIQELNAKIEAQALEIAQLKGN